MDYAQIAKLAAGAVLAISLLTGLVAFGVGHRRWSWTSVVAAFLLLLTAGGYIYLAARLLQHEWVWAQDRREKLRALHAVRDALVPAPETGRLERRTDGSVLEKKSIPELIVERDRWQRALDRIDTWRGRNWPSATFSPPKPDLGSISLPPPAAAKGAEPGAEPEAAAEGEQAAPPAAPRPDAKPLDAGDIVYVFDAKPAAEGGRYLGAFVIQEVAPGPGGGTELKVAAASVPDAFDREAWNAIEAPVTVTVFDELPADRWLAFSKTPPPPEETDPDGPDAVAPQPRKRDLEDVEKLLADRERQQGLIRDFSRHALTASTATEPVVEDKWPDLRREIEDGQAIPGVYWAEIEFKERVDLDEKALERLEALLGPGLKDAAARGFDVGSTAEIDLETAFALEDAGKATIRKVFYRRPLVDAQTLVHGSVVPAGAPGKGVVTEGLAALMQILRGEIQALEASRELLAESRRSLDSETQTVAARTADLEAELANWKRDLAAATSLAAGFEERAAAAARALEAAEQAIVELGRRYDLEVGAALRRPEPAAAPRGDGAAAGRDTL